MFILDVAPVTIWFMPVAVIVVALIAVDAAIFAVIRFVERNKKRGDKDKKDTQ